MCLPISLHSYPFPSIFVLRISISLRTLCIAKVPTVKTFIFFIYPPQKVCFILVHMLINAPNHVIAQVTMNLWACEYTPLDREQIWMCNSVKGRCSVELHASNSRCRSKHDPKGHLYLISSVFVWCNPSAGRAGLAALERWETGEDGNRPGDTEAGSPPTGPPAAGQRRSPQSAAPQ